MALLKWRDSYSVGVPELDEDHRQLIDIINRVEEAERAGVPVGWVLTDLAEYAHFHFQQEEDGLKNAGYPRLVEHAKDHEAFVAWLEELAKTYAALPGNATAPTAEVRDYLKSWVITHILGEDMDYKDYLNGSLC